MKTYEKYKYWAYLADYDMDTAQVLIEGKRWVYVAYMCHQAIERQLKGMYVYYRDKEAPKTHNLPFLFDAVRKSTGFPKCGSADTPIIEQYEDFFTELMFYYMSDYPFSYKRISSRFIDPESGLELHAKVKECLTWLRSLQPLPEHVDIEADQLNARQNS